jgi:hypothetical protein
LYVRDFLCCVEPFCHDFKVIQFAEASLKPLETAFPHAEAQF